MLVRLPLRGCLSKTQKSTQKRTTASTPSGSKQSGSSSSNTQSQAPEPPYSFLFVINKLPLNEDPSSGGLAPLANQDGLWVPPLQSAGFAPQVPGQMYRWTNGAVTQASSYRWYQGYGRGPGDSPLTQYHCATVFYCNTFANYYIANFDTTARDISTGGFGENRWYPLRFRNDGVLSRIDTWSNEPYLAGPGGSWVSALGLDPYKCTNSDMPRCAGLSGDLAVLIALVAFSCKRERLGNILAPDGAWREYRWIGHRHSHGRK